MTFPSVTPRDLLQLDPNPARIPIEVIRRQFGIGPRQATELRQLATRAPEVLARMSPTHRKETPDMPMAESKPITTLADAIAATEHALTRATDGCPALVTPHALSLVLDAAKREAARG